MNKATLVKRLLLTAIGIVFFSAPLHAAPVTEKSAQRVAENYLHYVLSNKPSFVASSTSLGSVELVMFKDTPLAYDFELSPQGHILVAYWDEFSPVLLYSLSSQFEQARVDNPNSIESWIIKEIYAQLIEIRKFKHAYSANAIQALYGASRVSFAWNWLNMDAGSFRAASSVNPLVQEKVGPLLSSRWGQGNPYNLQTPADTGCSHSVTGCVATAWAQLLRYWEWPRRGIGSHSYSWNGKTLTANFEHDYHWGLMPETLTLSNTEEEKQAVAQLMYDMGVAAEMNYSCGSSGSSAYADEVLYKYFKYVYPMNQSGRSDYTSDEWFSLIKQELDATPARPIVYSIFGIEGGGHEVIIDGYQSDATDKAHINFGWSGYSDGFYDVTNNFAAGGVTWSANYQVIVTNIQPNDDRDGDGVLTQTEIEDGSNPNDSGSYVRTPSSEANVFWNTYLDSLNVLEFANTSSSTFTPSLQIDSSENSKKLTQCSSKSQVDTILNDLDGVSQNSYGSSKLSFSSSAGSRITNYSPSSDGTYRFAYSIPTTRPLLQTSYIVLNRMQPSQAPEDAQAEVFNWQTLANLSDESSEFTLEFYSSSGSKLGEETLSLGPNERHDYDFAQQYFGQQEVGVVKIVPEKSTTPYQSYAVRYGLNVSGEVAFAVPVQAASANGEVQYGLVPNFTGAQSWLEIVSGASNRVFIVFTGYSANGKLLVQQTITLSPNEQVHLEVSELLSGNDIAYFSLSPSVSNSVVANVLSYLRSDDGQIESAFSSYTREAFGPSYAGSYNTNLSMENYLVLANVSDRESEFEVRLYATDQEHIRRLTLLPRQSMFVQLDTAPEYNLRENAYGLIEVIAEQKGVIVGDVLRKRSGEYLFSIPLETTKQ